MDVLLRLFDFFNNTAKALAGYLFQLGKILLAALTSIIDLLRQIVGRL